MNASSPSLKRLVLYFLRLSATTFGGPIVLAGHMQRDLVTARKWFSERDYVEGLALAQLAPGPLAAQLAIYLGWVQGRVWGATLVGFAFVLAPHYRRLAQNLQIKAFVDGVSAAALGAIAGSAVILGQRAIVDLPTALLSLGVLPGLLKFKSLPEPIWILLAGLSGLASQLV